MPRLEVDFSSRGLAVNGQPVSMDANGYNDAFGSGFRYHNRMVNIWDEAGAACLDDELYAASTPVPLRLHLVLENTHDESLPQRAFPGRLLVNGTTLGDALAREPAAARQEALVFTLGGYQLHCSYRSPLAAQLQPLDPAARKLRLQAEPAPFRMVFFTPAQRRYATGLDVDSMHD